MLEPGNLVDDVERVEALLAVPVTLVDGVDADEAGAAVGIGLAADADGDLDGAGLVEREGSQAVVSPLAEVVAPLEGVGRGLPAPVADVAGPLVLGDEPGELRSREAGHLGQIGLDEAPVSLAEAVVAEPLQRAPDEEVGRIPVAEGEIHRLAALEEGANLIERPNPFGAKRHDLPP